MVDANLLLLRVASSPATSIMGFISKIYGFSQNEQFPPKHFSAVHIPPRHGWIDNILHKLLDRFVLPNGEPFPTFHGS
jgi:hypothetical protein